MELVHNEKRLWITNLMWQEADWDSYLAANLGHFLWRKKFGINNQEGSDKIPKGGNKNLRKQFPEWSPNQETQNICPNGFQNCFDQ